MAVLSRKDSGGGAQQPAKQTGRRRTIADLVDRLRAAGCVFAEDEARLLIAAATTPARLEEMVAARVAGRPLEQILGWAEFCGLRIIIEPGVFVPRRRTEFLVGQAMALLRPPAIVVDLCCGSGALAAALLDRVPDLEVHASDIEPAAVHCARANLAAAGGHVYEGDLFGPLPPGLRGRVDVLVANVPYVPTEALAMMPPEARDHEPRSALDGGADGLDVLRRVAVGATTWLGPKGQLLVEVGEEQASTAAAVMAAAGLAPRVASSEDLGATVVIGSV